MKSIKRTIAFFLAVIMLAGTIPFSLISFAEGISVWDGTVAESFERGSGTSADPYIIANAQQLAYFASKVNGGTTYKGKYIKLESDIRLNDESFSFNPDTGLVKFTDGINTAFLSTGISGDNSGSNTIFDEKTTPGGYILASDASKISGASYSGDILSWTSIGSSSAPFKGNFDGGNHTISGLYVRSYYENGLFGYIYDATVRNVRIENSYVCGTSSVGGIAATAYGAFKIDNCANTAYIVSSIQDTDWSNKWKYGVGGIVGKVMLSNTGNAKISKCFNAGVVSCNYCAGGIVGNVDAYNTTDTLTKSVTIENCYNSGFISAQQRNTGGIVGYVRQIEYIGADLVNCYNVGRIKNQSYGSMEGALAGEYNVYDAMTYTNCYYQMQTQNNYPIYASYMMDDIHGGKHLSVNGSKKQSNYVGFDFDNVWEMNPNSQYPYPTLKGLEHTTTWNESEYNTDNDIWDGKTAIPIIEGDGTEDDPYLITCPAQLVYFARSVQRFTSYVGEHIRLNVDITLNDDVFEFIPDSGMVKVTDGTNTAYLGTGIFGDKSGEKNYFDEYKSVAGDFYEGDNGKTATTYGGELNLWSSIGVDYGTASYDSDVERYFSGTFDGGNHIVSGMYADGETEGLFGHIKDGTVRNVRVKNSYICGYSVAGGIVAYARGASVIENCSSDGIVVAGNNGYKDGSGGIVGYFDLTTAGNAYIRNCSNGGAIGNQVNAGGIVGYVVGVQKTKINNISLSITNCYNYGNTLSYYYSGGIVGFAGTYSITNITNCYNIGNNRYVYSSSAYSGGIVSRLYRYYPSQTDERDAVVNFVNCYYKQGCATNKDGSKVSNGVNTLEDVEGIKALTESELLNQASYAGFDFNNVWSMDVTADYPYPILRALSADAICIHNYVSKTVEPTCTEQGYTAHICRYCKDSVEGDYVNQLGHDYKGVVTEPTCTEQGYTTHTCSRCDDEYVDSYVPEKGHTEGDGATCTTDQTCTVCGEVLEDRLGHDYIHVVTSPTCTQQGYTTHTCDRCGDSYVNSYVPKNGHTEGEDATCTTDQVCTVCGEVLENRYGHNYIPVVTAPTCTQQGYTIHTCDRCGDSYVDSYVPENGHTEGEEATCTRDQVCTVCGEILENRLGHNYSHIVTEPTCTKQGYTTHSCPQCKHSYVDSFVPENGHTQGDEATCTQDQICTVCGQTLVEKYGHRYEDVVTEPTCTEGGYTTHTCDRCGDSYVDSYVSENGHTEGEGATCTTDQICTVCGEILEGRLGHNYIAVVTKPTCTEGGYTTHTCDRCGDSYVDSFVPENGHTEGEGATCTEDQICTVCGEILMERYGHRYEDVVTEPTCTEGGYTTHTCDRCGDSYVDTYVPENGHTPVGESTCTTDEICDVCGEILVPSHGHIPEDEDASCTKNKNCSICHVILDPMLGHNYISVVTEPTCTEGGYTTHTCDRCGDEYVDTYIPENGHTEGEWVIVLEPEIGVEGIEERRCTACGQLIDTRYIDALIPQYLLGDVNLDKVVDKRDFALLKRYCIGLAKFDYISMAVADVNQDTNVDKRDFAILKRYCLGLTTITPEYVGVSVIVEPD